MPFVEIKGGKLEYYRPQPKNLHRKPEFSSVPFVLRAVRRALVPGKEYHLHEIILLVTECPTGRMLNPPFRGNHAQTLIDRLVRKGKMTRREGDFYVLKEINNPTQPTKGQTNER